MNEGFQLRELPASTTIIVWMIDLDRPLKPEIDLDNILSIEERNRAGRFHFPRDSYRYRHCRAMLRLGLAGYLRKAPEKIELTTNAQGKPCLAEASALHFNVSHSGGMGVIAFTTAGEVGIDVEAMHRDVEALDIASAHFTPKEAALIAKAPTPQEQASIFLRFWTRKEALLKAVGCGLLRGLDEADVSSGPLDQVSLSGEADDNGKQRWRIRDLELTGEFAGAVAAPAGNWSVVQMPVRYKEAVRAYNEIDPVL